MAFGFGRTPFGQRPPRPRWGERQGSAPAAIPTSWVDTFDRATPGQYWLVTDVARLTIVDGVLRRTDAYSYNVGYTSGGYYLPEDYRVTFTLTHQTVQSNFWGVIGRFDPDGGTDGSGMNVFWSNSGPQALIVNHGDYSTSLSVTVTGGIPSSWAVDQDHTVALDFDGDRMTIYLDGEEYGYRDDSFNRKAGTYVGLSGDGGPDWGTGSPIDCLSCVIEWAEEDYIPHNDKIYIETTGQVFEPLIEVAQGATVLWEFSDETASGEVEPSKDFGSSAVRRHALTVTPWSALRMLNLGYDAGDDGDPSIPLVSNQYLSRLDGVAENASGLEILCASQSDQLRRLDLGNPQHLHTVECYQCQDLQHAVIGLAPALTRLSLEQGNLQELDVSGAPLLADLRGAANDYYRVEFGSVGSHLWHLCARDNDQMTENFPVAQMPALEELWIWNANQQGALVVNSPVLRSALVAYNDWTSADVSGCFVAGVNGEMHIQGCQLTSLDVSDCPGLMHLQAQTNNLDQAAVDAVLGTIEAYGTSGGYLDLTDNAAPSSAGLSLVASLQSRSWTVLVDA